MSVELALAVLGVVVPALVALLHLVAPRTETRVDDWVLRILELVEAAISKVLVPSKYRDALVGAEEAKAAVLSERRARKELAQQVQSLHDQDLQSLTPTLVRARLRGMLSPGRADTTRGPDDR